MKDIMRMTITRTLATLCCVLFIASCSQHNDINLPGEGDDTEVTDDGNDTDEPDEIIPPEKEPDSAPEREYKGVTLQERDPNLPEVISELNFLEGKSGVQKIDQNGNPIVNSDVLLGFSYTIGNSIMGNYDNVVSPVVDIEKVRALDDSFITAMRVSSGFMEQEAYNTLKRYREQAPFSKKVSARFTPNSYLFYNARKALLEDIFGSELVNGSRSVVGESRLNYLYNSYSLMSATGYARSLYVGECLSGTFIRNLYGLTISELMSMYGDFVLTGYYTGGVATVFYAGKGAVKESAAEREMSMKADISASYSSEKDANGRQNMFFGKATPPPYKTKGTRVQLRQYGGEVIHDLSVIGADDLTHFRYNLSPQFRPLTNPETHTIVDVKDGGLAPLSDFVLEENFRRRLDDTHKHVLSARHEFAVPRILIGRVRITYSSENEPLYDIVPVLRTRQGDYIVFNNSTTMNADEATLAANEDETVFNNKAQELVAALKPYFRLKIEATPDMRLQTIFRSPLCINLIDFNAKGFYRWKNDKSGISYIYDPDKKIGFSYLPDDECDLQILGVYGIKEWVESLPERATTVNKLATQNYTIVGL
ncbi:MAG: hypothetical protein LBN29_01475 [Mediterranea sp.]|jgi:hypothetical protein|nr:hypothetical protein [Mediterranea sp.]